MKIRKGTEVRIRRTNEIGTIKEVELIRKGGIIHKYCHVVTDKGNPDLWLDSSELTDIHDVTEVTFCNKSNGQVLRIVFDLNHKTDKVDLTISSKYPDNLKEQCGLHVQLATLMMHQYIGDGTSVEEVKSIR